MLAPLTGFGLVGHLSEMIENKNLAVEIEYTAIPLFPRTEEFSNTGIDPPGSQRNRKFHGSRVEVTTELPDWKLRILFDAQTSGGLIFSVTPQKADLLLNRLHEVGIKKAAIIGEVVKDSKQKIIIK